MKIAIASGKGGTGKTTFSVNLTSLLSENKNVTLIDLDVEEPNCNNYLNLHLKKIENINLDFPVIEQDKCNSCGFCQELCQFNALLILPGSNTLFKDLCHSCGRCINKCPQKAMTEEPKSIGELFYASNKQFSFYQGLLKEGLTQSATLIKKIKDKVLKDQPKTHTVLLDCPPGTTCPMVESIKDADFLILVTEPSIFGLHDLKDAVEAARKINIPFAVVINKSSQNSNIIKDFCNKQAITLLGEIPFSVQAASLSSGGQLLIGTSTYKRQFLKIVKNLKDLL